MPERTEQLNINSIAKVEPTTSNKIQDKPSSSLPVEVAPATTTTTTIASKAREDIDCLMPERTEQLNIDSTAKVEPTTSNKIQGKSSTFSSSQLGGPQLAAEETTGAPVVTEERAENASEQCIATGTSSIDSLSASRETRPTTIDTSGNQPSMRGTLNEQALASASLPLVRKRPRENDSGETEQLNTDACVLTTAFPLRPLLGSMPQQSLPKRTKTNEVAASSSMHQEQQQPPAAAFSSAPSPPLPPPPQPYCRRRVHAATEAKLESYTDEHKEAPLLQIAHTSNMFREFFEEKGSVFS
ncbi:hypothetical protein BDB00DRAFT_783640 [Zychaea mexicana]|uniref:uncharacterized protein n=1 Tax=Zychaea mexicana TaxID=64656 RepID=UPI0022FE658B|nr:uncharacterized protein BDB00DRAFT_783640 [Zychaea mexicana]KAI9499040.1 hypothetical protein BDB00DRAFT_783640 [Zychaea mexicana]